jgi:hypothetical protein
MSTVHIENTVQDFDAWKANFDKCAVRQRRRGGWIPLQARCA